MIAVIDASSLIFSCLALIFLIWRGKQSPLQRNQKLLVGGLIVFMGIYFLYLYQMG